MGLGERPRSIRIWIKIEKGIGQLETSTLMDQSSSLAHCKSEESKCARIFGLDVELLLVTMGQGLRGQMGSLLSPHGRDLRCQVSVSATSHKILNPHPALRSSVQFLPYDLVWRV